MRGTNSPALHHLRWPTNLLPCPFDSFCLLHLQIKSSRRRGHVNPSPSPLSSSCDLRAPQTRQANLPFLIMSANISCVWAPPCEYSTTAQPFCAPIAGRLGTQWSGIREKPEDHGPRTGRCYTVSTVHSLNLSLICKYMLDFGRRFRNLNLCGSTDPIDLSV